MIVQPEKETRNVNDLFYESERKRIEKLNKEFFYDVELTDAENRILVWLCGWDNCTFEAVMSIFTMKQNLQNSQKSANYPYLVQKG